MNCDLRSLFSESEQYARLSPDELERITVYLQCAISGTPLSPDALTQAADNMNFLEGHRLKASQVLALATAANLASGGPSALLAAAAPLAMLPPGRLRDIAKFLNCGVATAIAAGGGGGGQDMQVAWTPTNLKLGEILGFRSDGDLPGITTITFNQETSVVGFDIGGDGASSITAIAFPLLVSIDPTNIQGGYISIGDHPLLTSISVPLLEQTSDVSISGNPMLATTSFPALTTLGGSLSIRDNITLTSLTHPLLTTVASYLNVQDNPLLTAWSIDSLTSFDNDLYCDGGAFNQATVDGILAKLVSLPAYGAGKTVNLSGGTSSAPSSVAPGSDYDILVGRGATVLVNP